MSDRGAPARFDEFKNRAQALVQSPERLQRVVGQATEKLSRTGAGKLREARDQLVLFVALLRAWLAGDYREVSGKTLVAIAAAVLYFVVPFDVIPDFLFGWGLLDDAAVIGYVFNQIRGEIEAFQAWRDGTRPAEPGAAGAEHEPTSKHGPAAHGRDGSKHG